MDCIIMLVYLVIISCIIRQTIKLKGVHNCRGGSSLSGWSDLPLKWWSFQIRSVLREHSSPSTNALPK